ncbi:hypothetical protein ABMA70_14925 [Halobacteriovorax sp. XZX-3]|uniref:hypothetical protein n=1 Tax=unclassified Halobacteriovorax TaxID=2639665 RepID=UPI000CD1CE28|nr:hypothetical protein [Halobacteriovorax sp. DA5]POB12557.1 hypothetical protein C0Z22_14625 [Halobacteriovorax sp. DA5]
MKRLFILAIFLTSPLSFAANERKINSSETYNAPKSKVNELSNYANGKKRSHQRKNYKRSYDDIQDYREVLQSETRER